MSPQENKRIVRRIYNEVWNERRLEVADELISAILGRASTLEESEYLKNEVPVHTRWPRDEHR